MSAHEAKGRIWPSSSPSSARGSHGKPLSVRRAHLVSLLGLVPSETGLKNHCRPTASYTSPEPRIPPGIGICRTSAGELPGGKWRQRPTGRPRIVLSSPERRIIIDTKFYASALSEHHGKWLLHSSNLYQLFAYLKNSEALSSKFASVEGILLYSAVGEPLRATYRMQTHRTTGQLSTSINRGLRFEPSSCRIFSHLNAVGIRVSARAPSPGRRRSR
jgi:hypothetical protein